jgi:hypothetical protein
MWKQLKARPCRRGTHDWTTDGRYCQTCGIRRTRMPQAKRRRAQRVSLTPLRYGEAYCGECLHPLRAGELVGWRRVPAGRGTRPDVLCPSCFRGWKRGKS